jgi:membrane protein implicated in regulation of membrane protease activity
MPWWAWLTAGGLLLAAEMAFVDAEFYLVFLGVSALLVGGLGAAGLDAPVWLQWLLFSALAVVSLVFFRQRVYSRVRRQTELPEGVEGAWAVADERIEPGAQGRATLRGTPWTARNDGDAPIESGARVKVERAEGVILRVRGDLKEG